MVEHPTHPGSIRLSTYLVREGETYTAGVVVNCEHIMPKERKNEIQDYSDR